MDVGGDYRKEKQEMRKRYARLRADLGADRRRSIDSSITARIVDLDSFSRADAVYAYLSVGDEVDTHELCRRAVREGKVLAVPRCMKGSRVMEWRRVASPGDVVKSAFGVWEPRAEGTEPVDRFGTERSIALVPGFVFDRKGYRLGYGGGFYDAFLGDFKGTSIGLARSVQTMDELPFLEPHDVPVDMVATEHRVLSNC